MAKRVLLSERPNGALSLKVHLQAIGCEIETTDFDDLAHSVSNGEFDIVLLVADCRGADFVTVLAGLRSLPYYPPVLVIGPDCHDTSLATRALKCGCDGALGTPVDLVHLDSWMETLIRRKKLSERYAVSEEAIMRIGEIEIDLRNRSVRTKKGHSPLTEREFEVLLCLAKSQGRVCTRQELLEAVWDSNSPSLHGTLNTHINRIRMKIEEDLKNPKYLLGIYGLGYRLVGSPSNESAAELTGADAGAVLTEDVMKRR
jgi:DNA-binding response OmpR family regulator